MSDRVLRVGVALVALAGAAVAGYLTYVHYQPDALICTSGGGCETVQESSYAEIVGIPVALLGLVAFLAVLVLVAWDSELARTLAAAIALIGVGFAVYLVVAPGVRDRRVVRVVPRQRRRDRARCSPC